MKDGYNRTINYMRLSVTDKCNFRCKYCSPNCVNIDDSELLSLDELYDIAKAAVDLGVDKIRVTGGEPLIKEGIIDFLSRLSKLNGLNKLALTTNGSLLKYCAHDLKTAGVHSVNISLDTLKKEKFKQITNVDMLDDVLEGIFLATQESFDDIKLNVVLIGGFNIDEIPDFINLTRDNNITVRFIELMPIGECKNWDIDNFVPADIALEKEKRLKRVSFDGVSEVYKIDGYKGRVGLIRPMSNKFCTMCNKIRVTADGKIKTCLHSDDEYDLKGLKKSLLRDKICEAILNKPLAHSLSSTCFSSSKRYMNQIGG